jgi:integrase
MNFQTQLQERIHNGRMLSPLTVTSHTQTMRILEAWYQATYQETMKPELLTNYDFLEFRRYSLNVQRVAAATWNVRRAGLAAIAEWIGDASLMNGVGIQQAEETAIRWLDDAEFGRLMRRLERRIKEAVTVLEAERCVRERAMALVMLLAGLRVSEVCALQLADIEINERTGKVIIRQGKGQKSRTVPLGLEARKAITAWLDIRGDGAGMIFDITPRTIQRVVTQIGAEAQISGLSCHDLRHTFAKRTLDGKNSLDGKPVAITVVQKLLGHSRLDTTMRYVQPDWGEMENAVGGMR